MSPVFFYPETSEIKKLFFCTDHSFNYVLFGFFRTFSDHL